MYLQCTHTFVVCSSIKTQVKGARKFQMECTCIDTSIITVAHSVNSSRCRRIYTWCLWCLTCIRTHVHSNAQACARLAVCSSVHICSHSTMHMHVHVPHRCNLSTQTCSYQHRQSYISVQFEVQMLPGLSRHAVIAVALKIQVCVTYTVIEAVHLTTHYQ